uniref:Uncharacterized protein n=1 Tax=Arundo donax TaxID=35708 RepID=A0A0A9GS76_ARUDO
MLLHKSQGTLDVQVGAQMIGSIWNHERE